MAEIPSRLTAENGSKALMAGEFTIEVPNPAYCDCGESHCDLCEVTETYGCEPTSKYVIPWTTIKEIWAKAYDYHAAKEAK